MHAEVTRNPRRQCHGPRTDPLQLLDPEEQGERVVARTEEEERREKQL